MLPALQIVLRKALIDAVLAYLPHCDCTQADIDRVKRIKDDEDLLLATDNAGMAWEIVVHDGRFSLPTMLTIPCDPMIRETFYFLVLWREIERLRPTTPEKLGDDAREMAYYFEHDAELWGAGRSLFPHDAPPIMENDTAEWVVRIGALLMAYIEEFLA